MFLALFLIFVTSHTALATSTTTNQSINEITDSSKQEITSPAANAARSITSLTRYDLKQTLQLAIEKAPTFSTLQHQWQIANLEETTSLTKLLPNLDLSAQHSLLQEMPKTANTPWFSEWALTLTENIYDNGLTYTQYKISQLNRKNVEWQVLQNKNKLSLEIATQYLNYSLLTKLLEIREAQHTLLAKQFKNISHFYLQGLKTRRDFLRFKTQVLRSEIDVADLKNDLQKEREELKSLIGLDPEIQTTVEFIPFDFKDASLKLKPLEGLTSSPRNSPHALVTSWPASQSMTLQKEINALQLDMATRTIWPEISLSAGARTGSFRNETSSFNDNKNSGWDITLSLKYNLWDWGERSRARAIATHKKAVVDNDLTKQSLSLNTEIQKIIFDYQQFLNSSKLSKELLELEEKNRTFIEQEYRSGKVQYLDYISVINNLALAQTKFYSDLSSLQLTYFKYLQHQGNLYDFIFK